MDETDLQKYVVEIYKIIENDEGYYDKDLALLNLLKEVRKR